MRLTVEAIATASLAGVLAGVVAWRLGAFDEPTLAETAASDPFRIAAVWQGSRGRESRLFVFARPMIEKVAADGRLFATVAELPGTPFDTRPAAVYRVLDETPVPREDPAAALADGNRCLLAIDPALVAALGGPLTAVVTLRAELDLLRPCGVGGGR